MHARGNYQLHTSVCLFAEKQNFQCEDYGCDYFLHQDMASPFLSNPHRLRLHSNRWLPGYHHIGVSVTPGRLARNCSGCSNRSTMAVHTQLYLKDNGKIISEFEDDLPVNTFQLAYLSSTEDLYIVYNKPHTPPNCAVQILEGPEETPLDFIVRSFEGYPKEGIILFETSILLWHGTVLPRVSTRHSQLIPHINCFTRGKWKLYSSVHHCGSPLAIKGKTTFEAGQMYSFDGAVVKSLKRVGWKWWAKLATV